MRRPRGHGLGLWLLAFEMVKSGPIPPVTLALIASQVILYLQIFDFDLPLASVCVSATHTWYHKEWHRLLTATFFHVDDLHLYYNMISFLSKGRSLERAYGSVHFVVLLAAFSVAVSAMTVALAMGAAHLTSDPTYLSQCAVGFSGVLFTLKVITTYMTPPGHQYLLGIPIPIPSRWISWIELVIIQFLVPNTSFMGHLAGILVGLLYMKNPLRWISAMRRFSGPSYTYQSAATGWHQPASEGQLSPSEYDGHHMAAAMRNGILVSDVNRLPRDDAILSRGPSNPEVGRLAELSGGMSEEEQIDRALWESQQQANRGTAQPTAPPIEPDDDVIPPPSYAQLFPHSSASAQPAVPPSIDVMRRRRIERFANT